MFKRILGAGLGWTFGGPIGAVLGWWLAGKFDGPEREALRSPNPTGMGAAGTQSDFIVALLILCSRVMKADGQILRSEVHFVRDFLTQNFSREQAQEMMQALREFTEQTFEVAPVAEQIRAHTRPEERSQLLYLMFGIALADGELHEKEVEVIHDIALTMGLSESVFRSTRAMFTRGPSLSDAYTILGVSETASAEEIKSAYRDLAKTHHPDKVSHLGPEIKASAEEKFKKISAAYAEVSKARGI